MKRCRDKSLIAVLASPLLCAAAVAADGSTSHAPQLPATTMASCEFINGYCRISIHDPIARRIASTQVLQDGPKSGRVTPQVYAEAYAGRVVTITKMSFVPNGQGMRAIIEWQ